MEVEKRKWDEDVINDLFNDRDKELILSIPLPIQKTVDKWFWMLDQKGNFSVRSSYRKLRGEEPLPYGDFWKKLWSLQLPGKVLLLLWRACRACLPTTVALAKKNIPVNKICPWCLQGEEVEVHVLFQCGFARTIWVACGLQNSVSVCPGDEVFDVIHRALMSLPKDKGALFGLACWSLWSRRNNWVWNKTNGSVHRTKDEALHMWQEWKNARAKEEESVLMQGMARGTKEKWSRPSPGWVKINIDAAIFEDIGSVGLGCIIRGEAGEFLMARSVNHRGVYTTREAEALSVREAIYWTMKKGFQRCVFETDAKLVVDAIQGSSGRTPFHGIVGDCSESFKHFENVLVCHVRRSANDVAHALAKACRSMSGLVQEWTSRPPDFLFDVLQNDAI